MEMTEPLIIITLPQNTVTLCFFLNNVKQEDFVLHLFSNRSQMKLKCGKNISDSDTYLSACAPFLLFLPHIFTSSVIYF